MPETIYGYAIGVLDKYCFFHDTMIVVSSARHHAIAVEPDGSMTALTLWYPGERGEDLSTRVDSRPAG